MTSTIAPPPSTMSTTSANLIPTSLHVGQQVNIESRTWPGINKPGGHATITKLHYGHDTSSTNTTPSTNNNGGGSSNSGGGGSKGAPIAIDVKYILGGTEKHIELSYVQPYIELSRGGRSRRVDKKMNVESFTEGENTTKKKTKGEGNNGNKKKGKGGERKRKTLGDIDKNGGDSYNDNDDDDKGVVKKKKKTMKKKTPAVVIEGDDTKSSDASSTNNKKKNKEEEGKQKKKASSSSGGSGATKKKTTKSIASYFTAATTTTAATTSSAKSSTSTTSTSTSITNAATTKKKTNATPSKPHQRVKYSPNSILAVRAAHAKSYATSSLSNNNHGLFDTTTIGYELPVGGISGEMVVDKKKKGGMDDKKKKVSNSKGQESLFPEKIMEERKKVKTSSSATATANATKTVASTSSIPTTKKLLQSNHKTIQSLYKNECVKAQDFVNSMVGSSTSNTNGNDGNEVGVDDVASSPESCLELKMDSGRMNLFNSLLSEIMFKKGIDSMDIDEMIYTMNTTSTSTSTSSSSLRREEEDDRPFTLLEVKTYLQKLHDENRIFVSWEDGNSGIVYSI